MAVFMALKGGHQYAAYFRAVIRLGFKSTHKHVCVVPASLGLRPCVCHYSTKVMGSKTENEEKKISIANENNDPDHFGNPRNRYIDSSKFLRRKLANEKKADQPPSQPNSKPNNKLPSKTQQSAEESKESNVFGTIGPPLRIEIDDLPNEDEMDKIEEAYHKRRHPKPWQTIEYFTMQMRKLIREKRLGDALVLFKDMKQNYIIQPDAYMFNVLIGGCGRSGYTQMAFKLYKEMKERQLEPDRSTYTGLFNACATSPFPENGLKIATRFYEKITEKGIDLNAKTYHAAIKAFGRCGNLQMAFHLVDEMVQKGVGVTTETLNFLLAGCASDQDSGFLQAIRVWKIMKIKHLLPDIYSYNLLLRVVRDCRIGDLQVAKQLLFDENVLRNSDIEKLQISDEHSENEVPSHTLSSPETQLPDVLSPNASFGNGVALLEVETASKRLLMLGGVYGIVHRMTKDKVQPQMKTFTELLEIIPSKENEEEFLLEIMNEKNVRPDVDFFNILIKKRNKRGDFESAKNVLQLIAKNSLHVDIATFGTLAIGCCNWKDAKLLLHDMEEAGFRLNIQIIGALVHNACNSKNFWYLIEILKAMKEKEISAEPRLIEEVEFYIVDTKKYIAEKEKQNISIKNKDQLIKSLKYFTLYYKKWLQEMKIDLPGHPWEAYGHVQKK